MTCKACGMPLTVDGCTESLCAETTTQLPPPATPEPPAEEMAISMFSRRSGQIGGWEIRIHKASGTGAFASKEEADRVIAALCK